MTPLENLNPKDTELAGKLEELAEKIQPDAQFQNKLEAHLKNLHQPRTRTFTFGKDLWQIAGLAVALILLALLLNWAIRSLAPVTVPAQNQTATPFPVQSTPTGTKIESTSAPNGQGYDWHGTTLYLNAPLPNSPTDVNVYLAQADQHVTAEEAIAFANRFGIQGEIYQTSGEIADTIDYVITDGKQWLSIRSANYFMYYADYKKAYQSYSPTASVDEVSSAIDDFLKAHGFDFKYQIEKDDYWGGYYVTPLTPEGSPIHEEYFKPVGLLFTMDENNQVESVRGNLVDYQSQAIGSYEIISAQEALQKALDPNTLTGIMESFHGSSGLPLQTWQRSYPDNQTVTIYGHVTSLQAVDVSQPRLIQIDNYIATGNADGMDALEQNAYVEATGQFVTKNGIQKFNIETWKTSSLNEDGIMGNIQRNGDQVVLSAQEGQFTLSDIPSDIPLPFENAFVIGTRVGNVFEWKSIDNRGASSGGGGGGGGSGFGFYKLNLSGTPVPFPSPTPQPQTNQGTGNYTVKEGDTLSKIASENNITVEQLMQANGLADTNIYVGQTLNIPTTSQSIDGVRGIVSITIYKQADGSQRAEYGFVVNNPTHGYMLLEGDNLQELQNYQDRPVTIWGAISRLNSDGVPVVQVERYEIPFPNLKFQILKGTEQQTEVNGQKVLLFNGEDGKTYVQLAPNCYDIIGPDSVAGTGKIGEQILLEALAVPDLTFGNYPAICVFSTSLAINPKNGQPMEMQITADQVSVVDEPASSSTNAVPTASIDKIELVYYLPDPRFKTTDPNGEPPYIQPVWRFSGHYSTGDQFEILVQALKQKFLLPELAPYTQPG